MREILRPVCLVSNAMHPVKQLFSIEITQIATLKLCMFKIYKSYLIVDSRFMVFSA